ncbi:hypothetical protein SAMN04488564_106282 [Lentzea waywayandensis]|uniref:DUF4352 domain-containing protein n=1 Tax=Lentzea waywayandensis TaxID=84724 RepID=A0A1I6EY79_9PSEU|nr:hypothetical protein [Lentzea waywayandensis]SFR22630.1 hypothetical protein SAMN04488564_106282 [Lentzea waywayandensis]
MKFAKSAAGLCLLLAVAGCAGPSVAVTPNENLTVEQRAETPSASGAAAFGTQRVWASGLSVVVSAPRSLAPSATAIPPAKRTAVFTITVYNGSKSPYRSSQLAVRALADGQPAAELVDSVQGLNGLAAAVAELQPGRDTQLQLAFAVPESAVRMELTIQPGGQGQDAPTVFEGQA